MSIILVADDRPLDRHRLAARLRERGHEFVEAADGEAALDRLHERAVDLVLAGAMMPRMDGYELVLRMRSEERLAGLPVILQTAATLPPEFHALAALCGAPLVTTVDSLDVLIGAIEDALSRPPQALAAAPSQIREAHLKLLTSQLVLTHRHLQFAVRGSNVGIWDWHVVSNAVTYSAEWKRQLGYGPSEIPDSYEAWHGRLHPEDRDRVLAALGTCLDGTAPAYEAEYRLRHRDGSYRWILSRAVCDRDSRQQPVRVTGSHVDITALKLTELRALERERQARFAAQVGVALTEAENLADMLDWCARATVQHAAVEQARIWTVSTSEPALELRASAGLSTRLSGAHSRVFLGEEAIGRVAVDRRPLVSAAPFPELDPRDREWAARSGLMGFVAFPLIAQDEVVGAMAVFARQPLTAEALETLESISQLIALGVERKQLGEAHERLAQILEAATDVVTISQPKGPPLYLNLAARRAFGVGPREAVPTLFAFRHPDFSAFFHTVILPTLHRDGVWSGDTEYVSRSGRVIPVSQVIVGHRNAQGDIAFLSTIARDVTEHRALEERVRQAQKIEAAGQLAGGLAHDFNNLLTVIIGYGNILARDLEDDTRRASVDEIQGAAERAAQLTRQLLAFSRKQILQPRVLSLNSLIEGMGRMLGRLAGEHVRLDLQLSPDLDGIKADPSQIEQILVNLTVNSRDAMPHGGRLAIETANVAMGAAAAPGHLALPPGDYVVLTVTDTGVGMDDATCRRAFEPFFTTKEQGKGTGLGLATVHGIVKQSGGSISVQSEPEKGTAFTIFFPRAARPVRESRQLPLHDTVYAGSETILLVEDEAAVRGLVMSMLQQAGYTVLPAAEALEAMRIVERNGRIDMLLTDVVMPGLSGGELYLRLQQRRPDLRVLFMSGFADDMVVRHGVIDASTPFLQKPFTARSLTRKVRDVLDRPV